MDTFNQEGIPPHPRFMDFLYRRLQIHEGMSRARLNALHSIVENEIRGNRPPTWEWNWARAGLQLQERIAQWDSENPDN